MRAGCRPKERLLGIRWVAAHAVAGGRRECSVFVVLGDVWGGVKEGKPRGEGANHAFLAATLVNHKLPQKRPRTDKELSQEKPSFLCAA